MDKKTAYQYQGIIRYLEDMGYDYSEAFELCENYNVDQLRYRYNIPDDEVNKYWYKVISWG